MRVETRWIGRAIHTTREPKTRRTFVRCVAFGFGSPGQLHGTLHRTFARDIAWDISQDASRALMPYIAAE